MQFDAIQITSHIDINTGERLVPDVKVEKKQIDSTLTYSIEPLSGHGKVYAPLNASGSYTPGVSNVLYLYDTSDVQTETTAATPTDAPTTVATTTKPAIDTTVPTKTNPVLEPGSYIIGDSNSDSDIGIDDATLIQKYLAKFPDDIDLAAADANENGDVDIGDATIIQKYLAQLADVGNVGEIVGSVPTTDTTQPDTIPDSVPDTIPDTVPDTIPDTIPDTVPDTVPETYPVPDPEPGPGENSFFVYDNTSQTAETNWLFMDGAKLWIYNKDTGESRETTKQYTSELEADNSTYAYLPELPSGWTNIAIYRTHYEIAELVPVELGGTNVAPEGLIPNFYNLWDNITLQSGGNCYVVTGDGTGDQKVFDYSTGSLSNIGGGYDPGPGPDPNPGTGSTINFRKSKTITGEGWYDIYVYLFKEGTEDKNAEWPGVKMDYSHEDDGYYYYKLDVEPGYLDQWTHIIFNDGGSQTIDISINGNSAWSLNSGGLDDWWKFNDVSTY
jgi:hypothetical protein